MKKTLSVVLVVVILAAALTACSGNGIVGKWSYEESGLEMVMEFKKDGTGTAVGYSGGIQLGTMEFEYSVSGNNLTMKMRGEDAETSQFEIKGNKLTIYEDGEEVMVMTRK